MENPQIEGCWVPESLIGRKSTSRIICYFKAFVKLLYDVSGLQGGTKPLCHRRCGACATAPGLDGWSSLRTEERRHGGCGPARGAGWSAGGRRSPPAPRPLKRGCAPSSRLRAFLSRRPAWCISTFSVAKRNVSAPCPQPHGIIHLFLCSKTLTNRLYTDDVQGIKLFGAYCQLWMGTCHLPRHGITQVLAQLLQPLTFNTP
ncbi:uncharacterized protein LOC133083698 [Eubalaena glacialis]|uniref:uncharacterized protein LOC133083698 n=1 Tax=Eubalaena glacialis TaxID=27606 RepID=UPI002A59DF73|nr:uncharacterized protein LOC133083698 [Eubalaena glacialis]